MTDGQYVQSLLDKQVHDLNYKETNFLLCYFEESLTVEQFRDISDQRDHLEDES